MSYDETLSLISSLIVAIDQKISKQLSLIIHHKKFKDLESNWLSLKQLVSTEYSYTRIKIKILDFSWKDISRDLNLSYDIRKSTLYYKIYSRELNTAGGLPFGLIAVCHRISQDLSNDSSIDFDDFDDIYTSQLLSELGELCLCQMLIGIDDFFFGDNLDVILHDTRKLTRIVESEDFVSWQNLRNSTSSRFLNVVLPNYLIRKPYSYYCSSFIFNEDTTDGLGGLWGNSVFLLAINVIKEFTRVSWFGFLRAYDEKFLSGAIVTLPNNEKIIPKINLVTENDNEWADFGLTVLSNIYLTNYYGFFSNSSVRLSSNDKDKIINMMQTNLMACRFSHYVKVLLRDKVGNYDSPEQCKEFLSNWIGKYVMNSSFADDSVVARYPLKSYDITITRRESDSTVYDCELKIEPQYQYDLTTASILLSTTVRTNNNGKNMSGVNNT